jgi:hypothetical protein
VDPIVLVIAIVVLMPVAVFWALAKRAQLRGPLARPESRRPVESLVTEVIPEEREDPDADDEPGPTYTIDSPPPEADPKLRRNGEP